MTLNLARRIVKGSPLTAAEHDGNLDKLEDAIEASVPSDDPALTNAREWTAQTISQEEAEAGTATTRRAFTAQRAFQAVAAWWAASSAKTKLDGIATGATVNATDAALRDRATHTGTQGAGTITGLATVATTGAYGDLSGRPTIPDATPLSDATPQAPGTAAAGTASSAARGDHVHALPGVVTTAAAGLVPEFGAVTGKVFTDGGWATPSAGAPGGSSGQLQFNNGGAFGGVSTTSIDGSGNMTFSGRWIESRNGAASEPPLSLTGTWFTGGTATTTKPHVLIEPAGTTSTGWSTSGTGLGVNAPSGFTGNLLDLQVNGTAILNATANGGIYAPRSALDGGTIAGYLFRSGTDVLGFRCDTNNNIGVFTRGDQTFSSYMFGSSGRPIFKLAAAFSIAWGSNDVAVQSNEDLVLSRDAADTLAQRRTTNAQTFRVYNTFTSATNFERLNIRWTSNEAILDTEAGSGGGTLRGLKIGSADTSLLGFYGVTPVDQPAAVADATDAATAISQLNLALARLRELGLIAT